MCYDWALVCTVDVRHKASACSKYICVCVCRILSLSFSWGGGVRGRHYQSWYHRHWSWGQQMRRRGWMTRRRSPYRQTLKLVNLQRQMSWHCATICTTTNACHNIIQMYVSTNKKSAHAMVLAFLQIVPNQKYVSYWWLHEPVRARGTRGTRTSGATRRSASTSGIKILPSLEIGNHIAQQSTVFACYLLHIPNANQRFSTMVRIVVTRYLNDLPWDWCNRRRRWGILVTALSKRTRLRIWAALFSPGTAPSGIQISTTDR